MSIFVFYQSKSTSWGGGNQFLKALVDEFKKKRVYADSLEDAHAVLFNGYQELLPFLKSIIVHPRKKRIYRLGPIMSLHRPGLKWILVDYALAILTSIFAHIIVFQSAWSQGQARRFGFFKKKHVFIIPNAVDASIFFTKEHESRDPSELVRLIYTSWSKNNKKGFSYLSYLDTHLDFKKFRLTFIGNSPIAFKNIETLPPMQSRELADQLRKSDVFISPTKDDACSNAILEALACGLPVVALRSGGNSELIGQGGELFLNEPEMLEDIDRVAHNLSYFQKQISIKSIHEIADEYISAIHASI